MSSVQHRLNFVLTAIEVIGKRMEKIKTDYDFVKDDEGDTILDSVNARLQTIGENVNKIEKSEKGFFRLKLDIDPLPIIDFRNIISHDYESLDYQIIYKICIDDLPILKQKIQTFLLYNNEAV